MADRHRKGATAERCPKAKARSKLPVSDEIPELQPWRPSVIFDASIDELRITEERLLKKLEEWRRNRPVKADCEASAGRTQQVMVQVRIPESQQPRPLKRIAVLKRAPADAHVANQISTEPSHKPCGQPDETKQLGQKQDWLAAGFGPRITPNGHVIEHSILGDPESFYRLAVLRGDITWELVPDEIRRKLQPEFRNLDLTPDATLSTCPKSPAAKVSSDPFPITGDQSALENWQQWLTKQKAVQKRLSDMSKRKPSDLVMNSGEHYYLIQLGREKIERTLPLVAPGKGNRYKSEFWSQHEFFQGKRSRDVCASLSLKQKGMYRPLEFIKCPQSIRKEKGLDSSPSRPSALLSVSRLVKLTRLHSKSEYMVAQLKSLDPLIRTIVPHEPALDELEIVGQKGTNSNDRNLQVITENVPDSMDLTETSQPEQHFQVPQMETDSQKRNVRQESRSSLIVQGQPVEWSADPNEQNALDIDLVIHVSFICMFDSDYPHVRTEYLTLLNNGTTIIFYEWNKNPDPFLFDLDRSAYGNFYFDNRLGSILPGDEVRIPVTFKALREGIFKETWLLTTFPQLRNRAPIRVTFSGLAVWTDAYQFHCARTTPPSVVLFYHYDVVQKLQKLHHDLRIRQLPPPDEDGCTDVSEPEPWDYSVRNLREMIYADKPESDDADIVSRHQTELDTFFKCADKLCFAPTELEIKRGTKLYQTGYQYLEITLVNLFDLCSRLRRSHGLPELTTGSATETEEDTRMSRTTEPTQRPQGGFIKGSPESPHLQEEVSLTQVEEPLSQEALDSWRQKVTGIIYSQLLTSTEDLAAIWDQTEEI
ncbi:MYCBP-associated protein [Clonorchis sinensis]|uniref:MYCBP-associated protein n=1 Tax=Clonorchis sinensis TaxID=79923 RepID=G7Y3P5_CLOSI|nr:MYCBP-associated protein [Clonorchis sinensis]